MGYSYALCKTIDKSIDHFSKIAETTITPWNYSLAELHNAIEAIVPEIKWDTVEQQQETIDFWANRSELTPEQREAIVADIKSRDTATSGQVIHTDWGKFECSIGMEDCFIVLETSFHCDYKHLTIAIAKALELTAFDVQTGERVYNPYDGTEVAGRE